MKVKVEVVKGIDEPVITIQCNEENEEIKAIVDYLESIKVTLIGKKDGERFVLNLQDIYYFESVKNKKINSLKFKKYLLDYLVIFATIFTALVFSYVTISLFVFEQSNIFYYYF